MLFKNIFLSTLMILIVCIAIWANVVNDKRDVIVYDDLNYLTLNYIDLDSLKINLVENKFIIDTNLITLQSNLINLEYRIKELHTITVNLIKNKTDLKMLTFNKIDEYQLEQLIENYNLKIEDIYNDTLKLIKEIL